MSERKKRRNYIKRSKRSFFTLQIGQTSGGPSLAHKYPQTLHLQTGSGKGLIFEPVDWGWLLTCSRSSLDRRLSGIDSICCFPSATAEET